MFPTPLHLDYGDVNPFPLMHGAPLSFVERNIGLRSHLWPGAVSVTINERFGGAEDRQLNGSPCFNSLDFYQRYRFQPPNRRGEFGAGHLAPLLMLCEGAPEPSKTRSHKEKYAPQAPD